jgi:hypothetical protein
VTAFDDALAKRAKLALAARQCKISLSDPVELVATTYGASEWGGHDRMDTGKGYRGNQLDDLRQPFSIAELSTNPQVVDKSNLIFNAVMKALPLDVIRLLKAQRVDAPGEFWDPEVGLPHQWPLVISAIEGVPLGETVVAHKIDVGRGNAKTHPQIDLRWTLAAYLGAEVADQPGWQGKISVRVVLP